MRINLISDNVDTRTGMRLVGVDGAVVHTREELAQELERVLKDKDIGIIAVMEELAGKFPDLINAVKETRSIPLIVEIPNRHGSKREKDFLSKYVKEAVGVKV